MFARKKHLGLILITAAAAMMLSSAGLVRSSSAQDVDRETHHTPEGGLLYSVNTTSDTVVVGACENGNPGCSLRGAIQAANSHPGDDGIEFSIPTSDPGYDPASGRWTIRLTSALPNIATNMSITGPGANKLTVRRSSGGDYGIFSVTATGPVTLSGMTISNGRAGSGFSGGGIFLQSGTLLTVRGCMIAGNFSSTVGGGVANSNGTVTIRDSTISGNATPGQGGGVSSFGSAQDPAITEIVNSTISGNAATSGGGIFNKDSTCDMSNSTVTGNLGTSAAGGGVVNQSGATFHIKSSIVAGNLSLGGPDVSGTFSSFGFNLIGIVDGGSGFIGSDQRGTLSGPLDPKLDPNGLQKNGGPTQTIALQTGSPALDKGTSNSLFGNLTTDQRGTGFPRIFDDPAIANATGGDGADVGAFELLAPMSVSRKMHGVVNFDISLPLTGTAGIECRSGGANGDHQIIVTFPTPVTVSGVSVTSGTGSVSNFNVSGTQVTVNLTGVTNAQTIVITLFGVNNGASTSDVPVPMGVLLGDTSGNTIVNASDISQTKSRIGQAITNANFRSDINRNGAINASDVSIVKSQVGTSIP